MIKIIFIYSLIIFIYSITNIHLKEITIKKSLLSFDTKIYINNNKNLLFFNRNEINNTKIFLEHSINDRKIKDEDIFQKYEMISFLILFFGCFIMLYGAYYYKLALIIHSSLFIYYAISFFYFLYNEIKKMGISDENENKNSIENSSSESESEADEHILNSLYFSLFSLISGILIYIFISTDDGKSKKHIIQKFIYGAVLGCFLTKTIFYYIIIFNNDIEYSYYICLLASLLILLIINFFLPDNISYMLCSSISGSFYIINSLNCIISSNNLENEKNDTFITNIIIHIIIFICSIIFQNYHIKYKNCELPNNYNKEQDDKENLRISTE